MPAELVSASGSGMDPHITPAAARYQLERVAQTRGLSTARAQELIGAHTEQQWTAALGGQPVVNVLRLNLALDAASENGNG